MKDEVGMAGSKSTQTRFIRHKHLLYIPTLAFWEVQNNATDWLSWTIVTTREQPECLPLAALNKYININRCIIIEKSKRRDVYQMLMPYKSCLCTFWPCHPYFILQFIVFYTCFCSFFIALSIIIVILFINAILYGLLIQLSYGVIKWL